MCALTKTNTHCVTLVFFLLIWVSYLNTLAALCRSWGGTGRGGGDALKISPTCAALFSVLEIIILNIILKALIDRECPFNAFSLSTSRDGTS